MNKKLSIIMLLSCVGNVFSMEKQSGDNPSGDKPSGFTQKVKDAATKGVNATKDLPGVIFCSTVDAAKKVGSAINTKPGVALVSSACTIGGYQVYQLPNVQSAISTAKTAASGIPSSLIACKAGSTNCTLFSNFGSKVSSLSREAAEYITQHKVGACVAGVAGVAAIGGGVYAYKKYKEGTAAAAASRRQLEEAEQAKTLLEEADQAKILLDFVANFGGDYDGENFGRSPLVLAAESDNLPLVKLLIKAGADVNKQLSVGEHAGKDALFFAANWGRPEIVNVLLAAGANNFDMALQAAEGNKNIKADGVEAAGTLVEYQAVINAIEAAKAKESK